MQANKLVFSEKVLDQHLIALGKTGAGKSTALRHLVEHLLSEKKRVCVIDPKGDWYGLKASADGKGPGFPIVLFGDFKNNISGDVPLIPRSEMDNEDFDLIPAADQVAKLVLSGNRPCVIGMRGWTQGAMTKFWIKFASSVFNSETGEIYLVIDEVHNFAPKGKVQSVDAGKSLHWTNRIINEGRGIGLQVLAASQRPQKVHNDTLDACETLVAMRVVHPAARKSVKDWLDGAGDKAAAENIYESLASLERGEAIVWSPEIKFGPERVRFPMFTTYDSFAPPKKQKKVNEKGWATVDLAEVKQKLAAVIAKAKAEDPRELQKELREARATIEKLETAKRAAPSTKAKTVEKAIIKDSQITRLEKASENARNILSRAEALMTKARQLSADITQAVSLAKHPATSVPSRPAAQPRKADSPVAPPPGKVSTATATGEDGDFQITPTQQRVLNALAWFESIGNSKPSKLQVGAVALIDPSGGYFGNVIRPLVANGLIKDERTYLQLTDAGRAAAVTPDEVGTLSDYHDVLRQRVKQSRNGSEKTVQALNAIIEANGDELTNEELGKAIDIDHSGGYFGNVIRPLATLGFIERDRGAVRATEILFPPGLA
ncbi:MAG TPA: DUF87 domain-containing protein [Pyrinomonadaceae bacterium]